MHRNLRDDTGGKADPNSPKGYSIQYSAYKAERRLGDGGEKVLRERMGIG